MEDKQFSIVFTDTAEVDLDNIYNYIKNNLHADSSASSIMAKFKEKIMRLQDFPLSCPIVTQILPNKEYRKLLVDNYVTFYRVNEPAKTVYIMRILYGTRNYIEILKDSD